MHRDVEKKMRSHMRNVPFTAKTDPPQVEMFRPSPLRHCTPDEREAGLRFRSWHLSPRHAAEHRHSWFGPQWPLYEQSASVEQAAAGQ